MKTLTWNIIFTIFWITTNGQAVHPGGVAGVKVWLSVNPGDHHNGQLVNVANDEALIKNRLQMANHNPGIKWTKDTDLKIPLHQFRGNHLTVFTVYQLTSVKEECIYSFDSKDTHQLLLTSHRFADLNAVKYMNFPSINTRTPQINTYIHSQQNFRESNHPEVLRIGQQPLFQDIPVSGFEGIFYEMIIYDRTLSPKEKHQVESYLAIKYGLTLENTIGPYYNSYGQELWPYLESPEMQTNITVIGRDKSQQFEQMSSTSTEWGGFLNLTFTNQNESHDLEYVSMRSNDLSLSLDQQVTEGVYQMEREWVIHSFGDKELTDISWKEGDLLLNNEGQFWIKVYRQETDHSSLQFTDFFPASKKNNIYTIEGMNWDKDGSGSDHFTIIEAPELFLAIDNSHSSCNEDNSFFAYKVVGGSPPYQVNILKEGEYFSSQTLYDHQTSEIIGVSPGKWLIQVIDNKGLSYETTFYQQGFIPKIHDLPSTVHLTKGEKLTLSPTSIGQSYNYHWYNEENLLSSSTSVEISQPGEYLLVVEEGNCKYWQNFTVKEVNSHLFEKVMVFPNPSPDGYFQAEVHLKEESPLLMAVSDINGKKIMERYLPDNSIHLTYGYVPASGIYLLSFRTEEEVVTRKLVVK